MSNDAVQSQQQSQPQLQTQPVEVPVRPELVPLPEALKQIRRDANHNPAAYLDETAVPRGGE
jgi:hypothetical protein